MWMFLKSDILLFWLWFILGSTRSFCIRNSSGILIGWYVFVFIYLFARLYLTPTCTYYSRGIPQTELEADWRRPSQEREDEEEQDEQEDPGDQIPIPTHKPMDERK